jgi:signal transduction histidine kinase
MRKKRIKNKSYFLRYRNILVLSSVVIVLTLLSIIAIYEVYEFKEESNNLRTSIYTEKKANIKFQVDKVIKTISIIKENLKDKMIVDIVKKTDEAYDIAVNLYEKNKGKLTDAEIKVLIVEALRMIRFNEGTGYYFILDKQGNSVLHAETPSLEGKNMLNLVNNSGDYPIRRMVKQSKIRKENLISYLWTIPSDMSELSHEKIAYIHNLPFFNWIIGSGDYLEYHKKKTKELILSMIADIKYNKDGTIWIINLEGDVLLSLALEFSGDINILDYKDASGMLEFPLILHNAFKEEGGYYESKWLYEETGGVESQLNYVRYLPECEWLIGAFDEVDMIEKVIEENKSSIYNHLYTSLLLIFILLIILSISIWWISRRLTNKLHLGFLRFYNDFAKAVNTNSLLMKHNKRYREENAFIDEMNILLEINNTNISALESREKELLIISNAKDRFFSIIAHDLKNPFNSLIGILEILIEEYESLEDEERKAYINMLSQSSNKLFNLLLELLQWANLQSSGIKCEFKKLNIYELVNKTINDLEGQSRDKNILVSVDIPSDSIAEVDNNMMSTVIRNLLSNAIKFTNNKGEINISSVIEKDMLVLSIKDNGVGMGEDILDRLFKIEEKITSVGTNLEIGTGLGLILCKEFIEKNNGEISVTSELGEGSTFSVSIPLSQKKAIDLSDEVE